jgi:hypothetical protein
MTWQAIHILVGIFSIVNFDCCPTVLPIRAAGAGVKAEQFITRNDGTLMAVEYARRYPVFTIASGEGLAAPFLCALSAA